MVKRKAAIIGTVGIPANYGGFETLTEHLVDNLAKQWDITVYCSGKKYAKKSRLRTYKGARLVYLPLDANGIQSIFYDCISIIHALFYADVLLILGVSGGILLPFVKLFTKKKIVISIDGIEWKRQKWNKYARLYLWMAEWLAVRFSDADISDNEAIQDYTAMRYKSHSNIIEYGADHTIKVAPSEEDCAKYSFLSGKYAFNVCRIEPENNLDLVLEAFSKMPARQLVVVGNWNNSDYGKNLREKYASCTHILLLDPIYNQRELDVLRGNCQLYIHGHSAGGTNPSLVEAMYLGLPVFAFGVSYNKATTEGKAVYFRNARELTLLVEESGEEQLKSLGQTMKEIAERRYTWKNIATKYEWLLNRVLENKKGKALLSQVSVKLTRKHLLDLEVGHLSTSDYFYDKR
ncbi:DUF1972 domain-containing protein [Chitinophaga sancti]|uniref:DUF1972 domain-containing protein n=1 Tax=Chitinophaga sancti TaxID=1004 RepID=A0A1K1RUT8_9BACT|nr:DUF1972 domain-containing protein [Chitinophaga sancti]WQD62342.1 DUF1972 domain-containing protein [Chitinophaga sancti]WQG92089.1 DUF1972 domain-containing protein [Chitinophaga sancti]SFW75825.1 Glycosyltransferase involved in cell wall bisynthesis [Chitinophaga sancti]